MSLIVNPGSHIASANPEAGWTNTYESAEVEARRWLDNARQDVSPDIDLVASDPTEREGRWTFTYRHRITGVEATLETHGISDIEAYKQRYIFPPRVYWQGSSTADPEIGDFAAPGYVVTYRPEEETR